MTKIVAALSPDAAAVNDDRSVDVYDFRRPDRITKEQLRSLHLLHERYAQNVSTPLGAFLRTTTSVSLASLDQLSYGEFVTSLTDPTVFYTVSMPPLDATMAVELNPVMALSIVHRMLGGAGDLDSVDRPLTEIELNIVDTVLSVLLTHLTESWRANSRVQFTIKARDTRAQMLPVAGRNEIVVVVMFMMHVGEAHGSLKLCIPASVIEVIGASTTEGKPPVRQQPSAEDTANLAANLARMSLPVTAEIATRLSARELVALSPGDVVSLGRQQAQPVTVSVGQQQTFVGHLLTHHGRMAIRVQGLVAEAEGS